MGVKISELNEATSVQNSDVLPIVQNGETKKIPVEVLESQKVNKSGDSMTGALLMQGNPIGFGNGGNIYFKEDNYGDKFRILPNFSGAGSDNKLMIQSTTGDAGTDPQNWKDLVYIHADTGEINLIDILTCDRIQTNKIDLNNGAFAPKYFQAIWDNSLTIATEAGGQGLIMASADALYMFWISGGGHDQLTTNLIWGSDVCNISMPDSNHINVSRKDSQNMTCSVLFFRNP